MTVKELKEILKQYPENVEIVVDSYGEMTRSSISITGLAKGYKNGYKRKGEQKKNYLVFEIG